jgi:uncharacterized protein
MVVRNETEGTAQGSVPSFRAGDLDARPIGPGLQLPRSANSNHSLSVSQLAGDRAVGVRAASPAGSQGCQPCEGDRVRFGGVRAARPLARRAASPAMGGWGNRRATDAGDSFAGRGSMNVIPSSDGRYLLVFQKNEDFMSSLKGFLERERIRASRLAGIGAFRRATIAYYRREKQDYDRVEIDEQVELTSLVGNSSLDEGGGVKIHAHVNLGRSDMTVIGGHLMEGEVWPTLELFVEPFHADVVRRLDEETKLPLISS